MFPWRTTHPVALKSIAKVLNQKVTRRPKCFSFFFFFFFFFFRQASSNLCDSFTMVFARNSIFHRVVHQPIAFFKVWIHMRVFKPLTEELWLPLRHHFFFTCMHAQITSNKMKFIAQDCWIRNTVGVQGVFEESLIWSTILQPILHRKPVRETCCSVIDRNTSAQACIWCQKKWHEH